jgi:hypothetical protein
VTFLWAFCISAPKSGLAIFWFAQGSGFFSNSDTDCIKARIRHIDYSAFCISAPKSGLAIFWFAQGSGFFSNSDTDCIKAGIRHIDYSAFCIRDIKGNNIRT